MHVQVTGAGSPDSQQQGSGVGSFAKATERARDILRGEGQARLQPVSRIGKGGAYYNLAQLMKYLNV